MIKIDKEYFIKCECGTEGLHISNDSFDKEVYFSLWYCGYPHFDVKHKLRWIWNIIKGKPYPDLIIVEQSRIQNIIDVLEEMKE